MTDRIEMLNRALLRIGALPIASEQDANARQHLAIYDSVLERLAAAPFTFFKQVRRLVRRTAAPVPAHYQYAFQLPHDRSGAVRSVYADADARRVVMDYDIEGDLLLASYEAIWVTGHFAIGPERWPGDFRELFTLAVMAELALSVREDRALHDRLYQKAFGSPGQGSVGGLYEMCLYNDNQAVPSTVVGGLYNPLIDVRG